MDKKIFMLCDSITEDKLNTLRGDYLANIKYDGERVIAIFSENQFLIDGKNDVILFNRGGNIVNSHFKQIESELQNLSHRFILDGEIISKDDDFSKLQSQAHSKKDKGVECYYMVFDVLQIDGVDLRYKPLCERMDTLKFYLDMENQDLIPHIKIAEYSPIPEILLRAKREDREGIIIKDMNSRYESRRSRSWLKLKFFEETTINLKKYVANPKGYRCEDDMGNAVQVAGHQSKEVVDRINQNGECKVFIQYLEKTKEEKYRFISFRGIV